MPLPVVQTQLGPMEARPVAIVDAAGNVVVPGGGSGGGGDASAANQTTGNASLAAINAGIGAPNDTAATSDTGTFSLIALVKRWFSKLPASLGAKTGDASLSVVPASDAVFLTRNPAAVLANFSGTAGVAAADKAAANANRRGFWVQNQSDATIYLNTLGAAVVGSPSLAILAGAYYETPPGGAGTGAISIIGVKAGQAYSAREW